MLSLLHWSNIRFLPYANTCNKACSHKDDPKANESTEAEWFTEQYCTPENAEDRSQKGDGQSSGTAIRMNKNDPPHRADSSSNAPIGFAFMLLLSS